MKAPADTLITAHDPADGRPVATARGEGREASVVRTRPAPGPPGAGWAAVEGSLLPAGPAWVEGQRGIDTSRPSPDDIVRPARGPLVPSAEYRVQARSVVVLVRRTAAA